MPSSPQPASPQLVSPVFVERIWGSQHLEPWFPDSSRKIGEVWFETPESPVLIKFLFATENLSVQVHPGDAMARRYGFPRGKTEMWHILKAAPGAQIALGFTRPLTPEEFMRAAAGDNLASLLDWHPATAGQTWFVPAGAVHAIGGGITLCEIQQNSDITYRIFDFGRGRQLHLEESLEALDLAYAPRQNGHQHRLPVACDHFGVSELQAPRLDAPPADFAIVVEGAGTLNGVPIAQGQTWRTSGLPSLQLEGSARVLAVATKAEAAPRPAHT